MLSISQVAAAQRAAADAQREVARLDAALQASTRREAATRERCQAIEQACQATAQEAQVLRSELEQTTAECAALERRLCEQDLEAAHRQQVDRQEAAELRNGMAEMRALADQEASALRCATEASGSRKISMMPN